MSTNFSRILIIIISLGFFFDSCVKDLNVLFDFESEADFIISPGLNTFETFYFPIKGVATNIGNFSGGIDTSLIETIFSSRASITAGIGDFDWSRVQEVAVYAISIRNPQLREEIFYQNQISFNEQNELRLFSSSMNVKEIMKDDFINLEVAFRFRNITPGEIRTRIKMNFLANGAE